VKTLVLLLALAPPLPAGMRAMRAPDPVRESHDPQSKSGFACFEACGPSCACVGRVDGMATTTFEGKTCSWQTITCRTQVFCKWHDGCYQSCDVQFPGFVADGSVARNLCYRSCDLSCATGADPHPVGGWTDTKLDPGPPPYTPGARACLSGLAHPMDAPFDGTITFAELVSCR
jgi:hypothetical protein